MIFRINSATFSTCSSKQTNMGVESPMKQTMILESSASPKDATQQLPTLKISTHSVKRSLFGRVDHDEVMAFFQDQLTKLHADKMQRWNFDFANECPVSGGSFEWEKVTPHESFRRAAPTNDKVTKVKLSCKSSSLITSHWSKCKKADRRNTLTKNVAVSRKVSHKSTIERIK